MWSQSSQSRVENRSQYLRHLENHNSTPAAMSSSTSGRALSSSYFPHLVHLGKKTGNYSLAGNKKNYFLSGQADESKIRKWCTWVNVKWEKNTKFFYWNSWSLTPPTLGFPQGGNPNWCTTWERTLGFTQLFPPLKHLSGLVHPSHRQPMLVGPSDSVSFHCSPRTFRGVWSAWTAASPAVCHISVVFYPAIPTALTPQQPHPPESSTAHPQRSHITYIKLQ